MNLNDAPRRLIVTADDFGAAVAVNDAVEQAHRHGILSAASLMVSGAAAADAVQRARAMPRLGVGLHLVLTDGVPTLPPEAVSLLVRRDGRFRDDMVGAAVRIFASSRARAQLLAEVEAQFAAFAATGLTLDHINAHRHFHLHPTIAGAILRVGPRYGMRALRVPFERRGPRIERFWAARLRARARRHGLTVPDQVVGLAWTGAFDTPRMRHALSELAPGLTEIYTHPATAAYSGSAPGYRYADELAALIDPDILAATRAGGIVPTSFARVEAAA